MLPRVTTLHEMAVNFGLVSKRQEHKRGPKPFFPSEGKVAQKFLKMYTQLSAPKLLEQLNGNVQQTLSPLTLTAACNSDCQRC